jgi:hypothetical protein
VRGISKGNSVCENVLMLYLIKMLVAILNSESKMTQLEWCIGDLDVLD